MRIQTRRGRPLIAILAVFLAAVTAFAPKAGAATPASGTLSTANPSISYAGTHFTAANVTGQVGAPLCDPTIPAEQCDNYLLHVSVPSGYAATNNVRISIAYPTPAFEYDLYIYDTSGALVRSAATGSDPTVATIPAVTGDYTVTVVPFNPDPSVPVTSPSYTATITLIPVAPAAPPAPQPVPTYQNYAAPASMTNADNAGEPSIGAAWKTGAIMYKAYTTNARVTFDDTQSPAAATWTATSPVVAQTSNDPILFTDHTTGRTFSSDLLPTKCSLYAYSDDDGSTYTPGVGCGLNSGVDHQTIGSGPFATGSAIPITTTPTTTYPHAVYYCSQDIATAQCALSRDGGLTFGPAIPIYDLTQCGGIHGHVKVAPDGTVYVPNRGCGATQGVAVSTDNGLHWTVRTVPDSTPGDWDPSIGIGTNDVGRPAGSASNTIYYGYQNGDGHPLIAVSHDRGLTWSRSVDVGTAFHIQNTVFPAVVAGDDNRAAFAFLGTATGGDYGANTFPGVWHLYVAHTYDGGQTWTTTDATPNDPVQRGPICNKGTLCPVTPNTRNLLDFMDATVDAHGRTLVGYADGCINACVTDPTKNNFDAYATIARQSGGLGLFAQYDKVDLAVSAGDISFSPAAPVRGDQVTTSATIHNLGNAAAGPSVTRFYDGDPRAGAPRIGGDVTTATLAGGASTTVSVIWNTRKAAGLHMIYVVADATQATPDVDRSNNTASTTITVGGPKS